MSDVLPHQDMRFVGYSPDVDGSQFLCKIWKAGATKCLGRVAVMSSRMAQSWASEARSCGLDRMRSSTGPYVLEKRNVAMTSLLNPFGAQDAPTVWSSI